MAPPLGAAFPGDDMSGKPADSAEGLRVAVFGGPSARDGTRDVRLSRYQAALVGLVYGHLPAGVSRSRLIWLLWEEDDAPSTRHRLRQLVYTVGARVRGQRLFKLRGDMVLAGDGVSCDLERFEVSIEKRQVAAAAGLAGAGFLSGIDVPTREFDDWRTARSVALRSRLRDGAAALWSEAESSGDWPLAREAADG